MKINGMNRLMRAALLGAVVISHQTELKSAASSRSTMVEHLAEVGVLNNFTLGMAVGASSIFTLSRTAQLADGYSSRAAVVVAGISMAYTQFLWLYAGEGPLDESFIWGVTLGIAAASLYEGTALLRKEKNDEQLIRLKDNQRKLKKRIKERIATAYRLTLENEELRDSLLRSYGEHDAMVLREQGLINNFEAQQRIFNGRINALEQNCLMLRNDVEKREWLQQGLEILVEDLKQELNAKTSAVETLNEIIHILASNHELSSRGAVGEVKTCPVCYEERNAADFVRLLCMHDDGCKACAAESINLMLEHKDTKYAVCTHTGCAKPLTAADILAVFASDLDDLFHAITKRDCGLNMQVADVMEEKEEIAYQEHFNAVGGGNCPKPNCTFRFIKKDNPESIVCERCELQFCTHCSLSHTQEYSCAEAAEFQTLSVEDQESIKFIKANTKACPQCRAAVERADGCNHMACANCPAHFCYNCNGALPANPYDEENERLSCGCPTWPTPPVAAQAQPVQDEQA